MPENSKVNVKSFALHNDGEDAVSYSVEPWAMAGILNGGSVVRVNYVQEVDLPIDVVVQKGGNICLCVMCDAISIYQDGVEILDTFDIPPTGDIE